MSEARQPGQPGQPGQPEAAEPAEPDGLDAGGHQPAPPSEDPVQDEARDSIQDAFDDLQALHPDHGPGHEPALGAEESQAAQDGEAASS